jgi:hypothetical protein
LLEQQALLTLASLPADTEIYRFFLRTGLMRPGYLRGLHLRAEMVMRACVGLNSKKRRDVVKLLQDRDFPEVEVVHRTRIALLVQLTSADPELAQQNPQQLGQLTQQATIDVIGNNRRYRE